MSDLDESGPAIFHADVIRARLPLAPTALWPQGEAYYETFINDGISVGLFAPVAQDHQTPHPRSELYIVAEGDATLELDGIAREVRVGDLVFVPRNAPHRFTRLGAGFSAWVVFFD